MDDVKEILLRTDAFAFQYFHQGGNLPHIGNCCLLDGHAFTFMAVVAHNSVIHSRMYLLRRACSFPPMTSVSSPSSSPRAHLTMLAATETYLFVGSIRFSEQMSPGSNGRLPESPILWARDSRRCPLPLGTSARTSPGRRQESDGRDVVQTASPPR